MAPDSGYNITGGSANIYKKSSGWPDMNPVCYDQICSVDIADRVTHEKQSTIICVHMECMSREFQMLHSLALIALGGPCHG